MTSPAVLAVIFIVTFFLILFLLESRAKRLKREKSDVPPNPGFISPFKTASTGTPMPPLAHQRHHLNNNRTRVFICLEGHFLALIRRVHFGNDQVFTTLLLPGGGVDKGESPINAMKREVKEETGLTLAYVGQIGYPFETTRPTHAHERWLWPDASTVSHEFVFYVATIKKDQRPVLSEPEKFIDMRWITPEQLFSFAEEYDAVIGDGIVEKLLQISKLNHPSHVTYF